MLRKNFLLCIGNCEKYAQWQSSARQVGNGSGRPKSARTAANIAKASTNGDLTPSGSCAEHWRAH